MLWSESTAETYGSGLLIYHIFCDRENLPEEQRAPASPVTISAFVSSLASHHSPDATRVKPCQTISMGCVHGIFCMASLGQSTKTKWMPF